MQFFSKLKCSLASQLYDHSFWFFMFNDFPKMLPIHRLKVELVCHIKVCAYRFWIAVYHDGFVARFACGKNSMHTAIIKFNTLSNAVWSTSQHNNLFLIRRSTFILSVEGAVEIVGRTRKFCTAGIHHFVNTLYALRFAFFIHLFCSAIAHKPGDLLIRKSFFFGSAHQFYWKVFNAKAANVVFCFYKICNLFQEPAVNAG